MLNTFSFHEQQICAKRKGHRHGYPGPTSSIKSFEKVSVCNNWFDEVHLLIKYSTINVHHCGNIYYIFGHVQKVNVRGCQFVGLVHQFRSDSFGHLYSVKWITLDFCSAKIVLKIHPGLTSLVCKLTQFCFCHTFLTNWSRPLVTKFHCHFNPISAFVIID